MVCYRSNGHYVSCIRSHSKLHMLVVLSAKSVASCTGLTVTVCILNKYSFLCDVIDMQGPVPQGFSNVLLRHKSELDFVKLKLH